MSLYERRAKCRIMWTRKCPTENQCKKGECARFESEDEAPWLALFAREEAEKNDNV